MNDNNNKLVKKVDKILNDLFPLNRSLTGSGVFETFKYIKKFLPGAKINYLKSGTKVFDWTIPEEWEVKDAYVINSNGEKIIDFKKNNLHLVSYSSSIDKIVDKKELLRHLHALPKFPDRIPYRTSYYNKNWGFCCTQKLIDSKKFVGPFKVLIDSSHDKNGKLGWIEYIKPGSTKEEILISTYCCHPSLANDNLSGMVLGLLLFEYLKTIKSKYTYRLVIAPETIGAIAFLSQAYTKTIKGGMILSCVAGRDPISIKESFNKDHFVNKAAHLAIKKLIGKEYTIYPFSPNGSDERQYSSPGFRIVTPSIHKSKYYEYDQYHTSADNLEYITPNALCETLAVHKEWIKLIETYCFPLRKEMFCEYQLGKLDLYPVIGGAGHQTAHEENKVKSKDRKFNLNNKVTIKQAHLDAFNWLMHLADGSNSNFQIAEISSLDISIINEAIYMMYQKDLLKLS